MTVYIVTAKDSAQEIYRYDADAPIEWVGMGFAACDHTPLVEEVVDVAPVVVSRRLTKLAFVGLLGSDFPTILAASKVSVGVEIFVKMLDWATPDPDGTSVDLEDARVIQALNALEAGGLIAPGRAAEILA